MEEKSNGHFSRRKCATETLPNKAKHVVAMCEAGLFLFLFWGTSIGFSFQCGRGSCEGRRPHSLHSPFH